MRLHCLYNAARCICKRPYATAKSCVGNIIASMPSMIDIINICLYIERRLSKDCGYYVRIICKSRREKERAFAFEILLFTNIFIIFFILYFRIFIDSFIYMYILFSFIHHVNICYLCNILN